MKATPYDKWLWKIPLNGLTSAMRLPCFFYLLIQVQPSFSQGYVSKTLKAFYWSELNDEDSFRIDHTKFYKKAPPRKNRINLMWPFRTDRSIFYIAEYKPTLERDLTGWLSVYAGPIFYGRKMSGNYRGTYNGGIAGSKIAFLGSAAGGYFVSGWGQSIGLKMYCHPYNIYYKRVGLNLAFVRRDIRVFGPRAFGKDSGLEYTTEVYQTYHDKIMNRRIWDTRLRCLIYYEVDPKKINDRWLTLSVYGGVGLPLAGRFYDKVRNVKGGINDEWNLGETNNIIMMRHYDLYLGISLGFYFGDFWKKK
ncbi:MAG: hypothetical protein V4613_14190 [Bacteroidota bacterium]